MGGLVTLWEFWGIWNGRSRGCTVVRFGFFDGIAFFPLLVVLCYRTGCITPSAIYLLILHA